MNRGLHHFHRLLAGEVRRLRIQLAEARQKLLRAEAAYRLLLEQQATHEKELLERRERGELGPFDFGLERMRALIEQALVRNQSLRQERTRAEEEARQELVAARVRESATARLIARRAAEEERERARGEQLLLDEVAQQRHWAKTAPAPGGQR